jgi:hypothetical protein
MADAPITSPDIMKIAEVRRKLVDLAAGMDASVYPVTQQFPVGRLDQACENAVEALWHVMVLSHIHFDTPLPG